ncbi:MAG: hypothetical protein ABSA53_11320 [Streptosporangiaceae bacterium]|jgi:hypothetical protein
MRRLPDHEIPADRLPCGRIRVCGALAEDGTDTCKKYISRSRWSRRKTRRGSAMIKEERYASHPENQEADKSRKEVIN